jgi:hypothetical protein
MAAKLNEEGKFPLTPAQTSYGLGISVFIGAILAPLVVGNMNRRTNFLMGHASMLVCMVLMGILVLAEQYIALYALMNLYMILFIVSEGTIIWLYYNEVSVDAAAGLLVFGIFVTLLI